MNHTDVDDLNLVFIDELPINFTGEPMIISGSVNGRHRAYLQHVGNGAILNLFEIRYDYSCSPFNYAEINGGLLAVGYEGCIFLYDLNSQTNLLSLKLSGYFDKLYWHDGALLVTDSSYVYRIDRWGKLVWRSDCLGMDGVYLDRFEDDKAFGSAQNDPPDGWEDFSIDLKSGRRLPGNGGIHG